MFILFNKDHYYTHMQTQDWKKNEMAPILIIKRLTCLDRKTIPRRQNLR